MLFQDPVFHLKSGKAHNSGKFLRFQFLEVVETLIAEKSVLFRDLRKHARLVPPIAVAASLDVDVQKRVIPVEALVEIECLTCLDDRLARAVEIVRHLHDVVSLRSHCAPILWRCPRSGG